MYKKVALIVGVYGIPTSYNYGGKLLSNMLGSCLGSNEFAIAAFKQHD